LYWRALTILDVNYQSFVHVTRPLHVLWGQEDHLNLGGLPTTRWPLDKYVWDEYDIRVLPGTPPGQYQLNVGIPTWAGGYRLLAYDDAGQALGDSAVIATVDVLPPRRPPRVDELDTTEQTVVAFPESGVTLLGYAFAGEPVSVPGEWRVTLFWRADTDGPIAGTRTLMLLDPEGREVRRVSGVPCEGGYPFEAWRANEVVRDPILLVFDSEEVLSGRYQIAVGVSSDRSTSGAEPRTVLGTVEFLAGQGEEDADG